MSNNKLNLLAAGLISTMGFFNPSIADIDIDCETIKGVDAIDTQQLQAECFQIQKLWFEKKKEWVNSQKTFIEANNALNKVRNAGKEVSSEPKEDLSEAPIVTPEPEWPVFLYNTMDNNQPAAAVLYEGGSPRKVTQGSPLPFGGRVMRIFEGFIQVEWQGKAITIGTEGKNG